MDTNRYYFSDSIEDNDLKLLAVKAKEMMQQNGNVVTIFKINNEILCGQSPKQILFLMKQNKKLITSPSSSNENSPSSSKSYDKKSTPIRCNPEASNMPRKHLTFDDAEKEEHHPATLEFSTPIRRQEQIEQSAVEAILNPTIDKTGKSDEEFTSQVDSIGSQESSPSAEIAKMTANLTMNEKEFGSPAKIVGSVDSTGSQESSPSAEIVKMTENLTDEKEFGNPAKLVDSIHTITQESPPCVEVSMMNESLVIAEKELSSPAKDIGNIKLRNQESPRSAEITRMTSNLEVDNKVFRNRTQDDQIGGGSATNKDSPNPEENTGKSESPDSTNKYFISQAEGMKILEPSMIGNETPSPVKRKTMCSNPNLENREFSSPTKKNRMENSPEDTKITVSLMPEDNLNISPNETIEEIERDDRKRKSLPPKKRTTELFKSIPRVVKRAGDEINIEVDDLEYGASPTTSRSKSADSRSDSTKDSSIKSSVVDESKAGTSPKTTERYARPQERAITVGTSRNMFETIVSSGKYQSGNPSMASTAISDRSCIFESSLAEIETDPTLLKANILEFSMLLTLRHNAMKNSFVSLESFKGGLDFLNHYILNLLKIVLELDVSGKFYTEDLRQIFRDTNDLALKLINKLKSLEKNMDFELYTWKKCFQQIEELKAQYEPLFTKEGEAAVSSEALHVYECEMKEIWKKMDGMVMKANSKRSLFSHTAPDVERFVKMIVKCLILVGILLPR